MKEDAKFIADSEKWDKRELGASPDHVGVASDAEMQEAMDALGLQPISIRMQKGLIQDLKMIASSHGIGYQPLIRDILNRFVEGEKKALLRESFDIMRETASKQEVERTQTREKKAA